MQADSYLSPPFFLQKLGIRTSDLGNFHYQQSPGALAEQTLERGEGTLNDTGALVISTGKFTGRSPKDRFIVRDQVTAGTVDWNETNQPISPVHFGKLLNKITTYLSDRELWIRDCYACTEPRYRMSLRMVTEFPWASLFCYNMFLRPGLRELEHFAPDWTVLHAPGCVADPATDGTRQENFTVINLTEKIILIGGSAYTGEIKKGVFSALNYILPVRHGVLGMHCSANIGVSGDTALFFGLSGTGKTTLSADPRRDLIGDDEHGWSAGRIFNFEGGCYAKCIDLQPESEPEIFGAIRRGALLENVRFHQGTDRVNFSDKSITENTRVSYPLHFLTHTARTGSGTPPRNIFFLTCDAYGVLPPISRLTRGQAMYQFLSGYTAKVAGTEAGVSEPRAVFSACYGAPFLPLHPAIYARMLGEKIDASGARCWLVNTGWTGGPYGSGARISLPVTRALINAALADTLEGPMAPDPVFGLEVPRACPGVPSGILSPMTAWKDPTAYQDGAGKLIGMFRKNFQKLGAAADAIGVSPF